MSIIFGNESEFFSPGSAIIIASDTIDSDKFVVAYTDASAPYYGKAKVGVISGTAISFGDESEYASSGIGDFTDIASLSTSGFVVAYRDRENEDFGTARIGSISGTTISFGAEYPFVSSGNSANNAVVKISESGFIVAYAHILENYGAARVGNVSGTTISFGEEFKFSSSGSVGDIDATTISSSGFVVAYKDSSDNGHGTAKVGTISGTTISFGGESEYLSTGASDYNSVAGISESGFVVAYRDLPNGGFGKVRIGTISGTIITFGTESEFSGLGFTNYNSVGTLSESRFIVGYKDQGDLGHGTAKTGEIEGATITFGEESEFANMGTADYISITVLSGVKFVVSYTDNSDSGHGTAKVGTANEDIAKSSDLYNFGYDKINISHNLFVYGHNTPDLFISGSVSEINPTSGLNDLFVYGYDTAESSGNLFVYGLDSYSVSGDLYVNGLDNYSVSDDLFVNGHINVESSGDLFVRGKDNLFCLYPDNVVFYHPVNDYTEDTQQLPWNRNIVTFDDGIIISGATITASGNTAVSYDNQNNIYPSISGATSIAIAYWGKSFYRTGPNAELFVHNSSDGNSPVDENGLHVHGNNGKPSLHINGSEYTSVGALSPLPNDTEWHFTVIYAEISGGNWRVYGSIDGGNLDLLGTLSADQPLGNQRYLTINIDDSTEATPAPIVDEIICWANLSAPFEQHEITNLYGLAQIFSAPMDEYSLRQSHMDTRTLFISGPEQDNASGDLFVNGQATKTASAELFIQGFDSSSISGDMFVDGHISATISGDLCITGFNGYSASGDMFIGGHIGVATSGDLFVKGLDNTAVSGDLFINGITATQVSNDINLFIHGFDTLAASGDFWINGHENALAFGDIFVHGYDNHLASGDLYLNGHIVVETSGNLFTDGIIQISNSADMFISDGGTFPHSGSFNLIINGLQPKPALSCPILDQTASIQIKDSLIKIYQSRIDALINQLGKNVYLEFDPISDPCVNCTYDIMRKRSTGIYIPGGPRPFKRGRRCPWCKGRGFTETAVNKCIKCLIKWNPEDAKNFGISVSKNSGIVRLKTFLTEADDLMRAQTIIVNHDIVGQMKLRVKLIQGPIPVGLREDRYCISFWELI